MQIETGCQVILRGVARNTNGKMLLTDEHPIHFTVGNNETLVGIERAVIGLRAGEHVQFTCLPQDAYGPHRPELVFEAVHANLPPDLELVPGAMLSPGGSDGRFHLKVLELTENGARLDGNHPLAGFTLQFDLEIIEVSRP